MDERIKVRKLIHAYNLSPPASADPENVIEGSEQAQDVMGDHRRKIISKILRLSDEQVKRVEVEPPFYW